MTDALALAEKQIESTGYKPSEEERIKEGIAECRRQMSLWANRLHLLQSERNTTAGVSFVQRENSNGRMAWFVLLDGKVVCRDYGYSRLGTAMGAATQIKAIK
jgi:hypothetical protein